MSPRRSGPSLRRHILPGLFVALLFVTLWQRTPDPDGPGSELLSFMGESMGTTFSVKLIKKDKADQGDGVSDALREELALVVNSMSTYEKASELSKWNQRTDTAATEISKPLSIVVAAATEISEKSGGAFDITVQPLVDLWGFGPTKRKQKPSTAEIAEALKNVGWQKVLHDQTTTRLGKTVPGVWLDLSAIAKGYAVDRISNRLTKMGYANHFVEVGGEVRAQGQKGVGVPWRVGIEQPANKKVRRLAFPISNKSVATSGSYLNYRRYGEETFTHTLDPRTGSPVTHRLISVSVAAETCMMADGWATALSVLGPDEGYTLATKLGLAASFLSADPEGAPQLKQTEAFKLLMKPAKIAGE